jgi:hypothetical protein
VGAEAPIPLFCVGNDASVYDTEIGFIAEFLDDNPESNRFPLPAGEQIITITIVFIEAEVLTSDIDTSTTPYDAFNIHSDVMSYLLFGIYRKRSDEYYHKQENKSCSHI